MCSRRRVDDERLRVACTTSKLHQHTTTSNGVENVWWKGKERIHTDIGEVARKLQAIDDRLRGLCTAFDAEAEHAAECIRLQQLQRERVGFVAREAEVRHPGDLGVLLEPSTKMCLGSTAWKNKQCPTLRAPAHCRSVSARAD